MRHRIPLLKLHAFPRLFSFYAKAVFQRVHRGPEVIGLVVMVSSGACLQRKASVHFKLWLKNTMKSKLTFF